MLMLANTPNYTDYLVKYYKIAFYILLMWEKQFGI